MTRSNLPVSFDSSALETSWLTSNLRLRLTSLGLSWKHVESRHE